MIGFGTQFGLLLGFGFFFGSPEILCFAGLILVVVTVLGFCDWIWLDFWNREGAFAVRNSKHPVRVWWASRPWKEQPPPPEQVDLTDVSCGQGQCVMAKRRQAWRDRAAEYAAIDARRAEQWKSGVR